MLVILKMIMEEKENEKEKLLDVSIGLVLLILKLRNPEDGRNSIERAGIKDENFVKKLVEILRRYEDPESKVPRMRRFVIGLAATVMTYEDNYIELFWDLGMEQVLMQVTETTSELECYNLFSGCLMRGSKTLLS